MYYISFIEKPVPFAAVKKKFANQLRCDDVNTMNLVSVFIGVARGASP